MPTHCIPWRPATSTRSGSWRSGMGVEPVIETVSVFQTNNNNNGLFPFSHLTTISCEGYQLCAIFFFYKKKHYYHRPLARFTKHYYHRPSACFTKHYYYHRPLAHFTKHYYHRPLACLTKHYYHRPLAHFTKHYYHRPLAHFTLIYLRSLYVPTDVSSYLC